MRPPWLVALLASAACTLHACNAKPAGGPRERVAAPATGADARPPPLTETPPPPAADVPCPPQPALTELVERHLTSRPTETLAAVTCTPFRSSGESVWLIDARLLELGSGARRVAVVRPPDELIADVRHPLGFRETEEPVATWEARELDDDVATIELFERTPRHVGVWSFTARRLRQLGGEHLESYEGEDSFGELEELHWEGRVLVVTIRGRGEPDFCLKPGTHRLVVRGGAFGADLE